MTRFGPYAIDRWQGRETLFGGLQVMSDATAYMLQRLSAAMLAPLVLLHLGLIIYAIEGGLSAGEILARTRSSLLWPILYTVFIGAVAVHAPLGVRNIITEWTGKRGGVVDIFLIAFFLLLVFSGLRAVLAIM